MFGQTELEQTSIYIMFNLLLIFLLLLMTMIVLSENWHDTGVFLEGDRQNIERVPVSFIFNMGCSFKIKQLFFAMIYGLL